MSFDPNTDLGALGARRTEGPISTWRYCVGCFLCLTVVAVGAAIAKMRWGLSAPGFTGLVGALISVLFAAWLFAKRNRRPPLPIERRWLTIGCFLAFWFYDEFLKNALGLLARGPSSARDVAIAILGTIVDFVIIWALFRYAAPWMLSRYNLD